MVDAHAHLLGLGQSLQTVNLFGAKSYDEVIARVVARAKGVPAGQWILGRGWDQNQWGDTRFPTHDALSRALPNNPVYLTRVDGHAGLANAAAMRAANVTAASKDPSGGKHRAHRVGRPHRRLHRQREGSRRAGDSGERTREETRAAIRAAIAESQHWGLVGLHDAGESRATIDLMEEMAKAGEITFRLYVMIGDDSAAVAHYLARGPQSGLYDNHLWIRSIKLYADGALGSRGAALLEPYSDDANNKGLLLSAPAHIQDVADARAARRLPGGHARHRRSRQSRRARRLRRRAQGRSHRRSPLPRGARADPQPRRHSALRRARRHSVDAGRASDERHVLGRQPPRRRTAARRVCVALPAQDGRRRPQWQRLSGGGGQSAAQLPQRRRAAGRRELAGGRLAARAEDDARGSAQEHDDLARLRRVSRRRRWARSLRASSPISSSSTATS